MLIMSPKYREELRQLKERYSKLPWYKRFWFSLWSFRLSNALAQIDPQKTTDEQVRTLIELSNQTWFFKSIFGLLERFKQQSLCYNLFNNHFNSLPAELIMKIAGSLPSSELAKLACTSSANYEFFKPLLPALKFLFHVVRGEQEAAQAMLYKNIELLLKKERVTDYSGRCFFNISGFQYALWALDKHMWIMMLNCIPLQSKEVGVKLLAQYEEVEQKGVTYELEGKIFKEQHYDFAIIKALEAQCAHFVSFRQVKNWKEIERQWREDVGGAQRKFPMHVVHEWCCRKLFYPVPSFQEQPPQTQKISVTTFKLGYLVKNYRIENWFGGSVGNKLGVDFAIWKGGRYNPGAERRNKSMHVEADEMLLAMQALREIRTKEFKQLKPLLEKKQALEAQSSVSYGR